MKKLVYISILYILPFLAAKAQNTSAIVEYNSTSKGILIPRLTQTQRNAIITPAQGLMIFQSDNTSGFYFYDGTSWRIVGSTSSFNPANIWINPDSNSVALGANALYNKKGKSNTAIGIASMFSNLSGTSNVALGFNSLNKNIIGSDNTAVGTNALMNSTNSRNTAIGSYVLQSNTSGTANVAIGHAAGYLSTTATDNTFVGHYSGYNTTTGVANVFLGSASGFKNTTGNYNILIGYNAGANSTTASDNTFIGITSGYATTTGGVNTFVGSNSGRFNTTGVANVFLGNATGFSSTTANENTFVGNVSGYATTTGGANTFIGATSGRFNTTGNSNTSLGYASLFSNTTGTSNVAIGQGSLYNNVTGTGNIALGLNAGSNETGNNKLYIENSNSSSPLIGGDFSTDRVGINRPITSLTNTFEVGGEASKATAGSWIANSDKRLKKNIQYLNSKEALALIIQMKGANYEWNDNQTGIKRPQGQQLGFIAQDIQTLFPNKVKEDNLGYLQTAYGDYDPLFVESIKALYNENVTLKSEVEQLKASIDNLTSLVKSQLGISSETNAKISTNK